MLLFVQELMGPVHYCCTSTQQFLLRGTEKSPTVNNVNGFTFDMHHGKTELKVFVVVISKEGLVGWGPANPSVVMTPTTEYNL